VEEEISCLKGGDGEGFCNHRRKEGETTQNIQSYIQYFSKEVQFGPTSVNPNHKSVSGGGSSHDDISGKIGCDFSHLVFAVSKGIRVPRHKL
jgi:hypothetical protein